MDLLSVARQLFIDITAEVGAQFRQEVTREIS
jgi:hypothetical protein